MPATARALHYVLKIGDRAKNMDFFRNVLGMTVSDGFYVVCEFWVIKGPFCGDVVGSGIKLNTAEDDGGH